MNDTITSKHTGYESNRITLVNDRIDEQAKQISALTQSIEDLKNQLAGAQRTRTMLGD